MTTKTKFIITGLVIMLNLVLLGVFAFRSNARAVTDKEVQQMINILQLPKSYYA